MFGAFFPKRGCSLLCLCDSVPGLCRFLTVRPVHRGAPTFTKTGLVLFRVSEECVQTSCLCSIMTHNLLNVLTWWHAYGEGRNNSSVLFFKVCPGFLGYVWRQLHQDCASDVAEWCRCGENEVDHIQRSPLNKKVPSSGKEWRQVVNRQGEPWSPCSGFLSGAGAVPAWPKWGDVRL